MNKPVLVLVMSQMCGACQNFKRKGLPALERDLKNDSRFRFIVLDFPEMAIPVNKDGKEYHPELRNGFVEFFPTFLLFPGHLWNNKDSKLKGVAKHDLRKNPNVDYSKASIISWIEETINQDPLFNSSNIMLINNNNYNNNHNNHNNHRETEKYVVPTYGTYNRFKSTKIDDSL